MPSFELSKLQAASPPRALSESDRTQMNAPAAARAATTAPSAQEPGVAIEVGTAVDSSKPPFDNERVQEIRDALRDGSYPLVPTKIADAMIAARLSFGMPK